MGKLKKISCVHKPVGIKMKVTIYISKLSPRSKLVFGENFALPPSFKNLPVFPSTQNFIIVFTNPASSPYTKSD
jgi:hypothetical protein